VRLGKVLLSYNFKYIQKVHTFSHGPLKYAQNRVARTASELKLPKNKLKYNTMGMIVYSVGCGDVPDFSISKYCNMVLELMLNTCKRCLQKIEHFA